MTSITVGSSAPSLATSTAALTALTYRAEQALHDVTSAHHAFTHSRTTALHGSLSLAVSHAQQVLKALESVREQRERQRQQQQPDTTSTGSASSQSLPSSPSKSEIALSMRMEKLRIDLRRVLPRAVAAMEEADNLDGGAGSSRSAASTAAALRSLLLTRSMLSVELKKMDTAVQGLAGSGESLAALHTSLQDVHSSMETAQLLVRKLLAVQSRDDLLLRVSAVLFVLAVAYVVVQRVFRFFPATVYVTVGE